MTFSFGKKSNAVLDRAIHPDLAKVARLAITLSDVDFGIPDSGGSRTAAEQNEIYQIGRTKPGRKVTDKDGYRSASNHQVKADGYGYALDAVPWVAGKGKDGAAAYFWDDTLALHYPVAVAFSRASKELGVPIVWGGNWYERMSEYDSTIEAMKAAIQRYKDKHPGRDFFDAPHFQLADRPKQ